MSKLRRIVYLSEAQYNTLIANGSVTSNGLTIIYNNDDIYLTPTGSKYVEKTGDTMTGKLILDTNSGNDGLLLNYINNSYATLKACGYNGTASDYTMKLQLSSGSGANGVIIQGIATPQNNSDAANKAYVDSKADDHKWNNVSLNKTEVDTGGADILVPYVLSVAATEAKFVKAGDGVTAKSIAMRDGNGYIRSVTPSANDNSTKVATTQYVDAVADDKTWNGVGLNKSDTISSESMYLAARATTSATTAYLITAVKTPTLGLIPLYSATGYTVSTTPTNAYLLSTTPDANDSSNKVATTEYVNDALSGLNFTLDYGQVLPLTGEEGDVFLQISDDPAGTSVPLGGTTGLALVKLSNDDGDAGWAGPYVAKAGDTMTGTLNTFTNLVTTVPSSALDSYQVIRLADSVNAEVGGINAEYSPNTNRGICIYADKEINNTTLYNSLSLAIRDDGTKAVYVSDPDAWCTGIGAVNKAGDTITGDLYRLHTELTKGTNPSATTWYNANTAMVIDSTGGTGTTSRISYIEGSLDTSGKNTIWLRSYRWTANSADLIYIAVEAKNDGTGRVYSNAPIEGAVWNDYAEYRQANSKEPGRCVIEQGDDTLTLSTDRMLPGAEIISDTFGFAIGETEKAKTPIAVTGRVLAYPYEDREEFKKNIGRPVCSGPNGTVSIMTDEEYASKGYCAIGFISAVPDYEVWGENNILVNGRVWIRVR